MPADNTPNTPDKGTGALSIDSAVDALLTPLTPPPRNTKAPRDDDDDQEVPPPSDDPGDGETPPDDADTDDDQAEPTDTPEEEAPDDESDTPSAEPQYKVVIDGKETAVPVSELVEGYQRQGAFTQRSQELAEQRRGFENERDAVRQERSQYARLLSALETQVKAGGEQEPNWAELQDKDPIAYSIEWARWNQRQEKLRAIQSEQQRLNVEHQREQQGALHAHVSEQAKLLLEKVPEYRDPTVRQKDRDGLQNFAVNTYGFTPQEIDSLYDHRAVLVFRDARAYRALQSKKGLAEKRVIESEAPPLVRKGNGAAPMPQARIKAASQRLERTGKLQDAVELEMARSQVRQRHGNGSSDR